MKLVAKFSLVLGATLALVFAVLGYGWVRATQAEIERSVEHDHEVVGRVLAAGIAEVWADTSTDPQRAEREIDALLDRSSEAIGNTRFEWHPGEQTPAEIQRIEGTAFVSRFPVVVGSRVVGTLVGELELHYIQRLLELQLWFAAATVALIVIICLIASLAMGRWLVGRPVALLVDQARKIGRRELTGGVPFRRRDELGELALELKTAGDMLEESLARTDAETAARLRAVEHVRHSDRLATVGKLAAGIAHELGTPLSVVAGHAQMISGGEVSGEAALASARAIDLEVTRMGKIVRQLLDFARRKGPEGAACDPAAVTKRCATLLAVMAERHAVRIDVREPKEAIHSLIDEDSLQQVITNLMVNAIQAMPKGGELAIAVVAVTAAHDGAPAKPCVRIDVRDTGMGIPEELRAHIFEPFVTTKDPGDGTGLGLAVVHGIVVDHGGWITVDSSAHGTTFSLYLQEVQP